MDAFFQKYALVWIIAISCVCIILCSHVKLTEVYDGKSNHEVWAIYFAHFGNYETDGKWINWKIKKGPWVNQSFEPPLSIPSVYYPFLGLYSSHHKPTIKKHLKMLVESLVSAIIVEWDGPNRKQLIDSDTNFTDTSLQLIFSVASQFNIQVGIILSDYYQQTNESIKEDINYYLSTYTDKENCLKINSKPVIFINNKYNYLIEFAQSNVSFIGFGDTIQDALNSFENGFIGFSTYSSSLKYSSINDPLKWKYFSKIFSSRKMQFIPSISPGFNASAFNTQLSHLSISRGNGKYYESQWKDAIESGSNYILINSFNNWFYGNVIEPVESNDKFTLNNDIWAGNDSFYFLHQTKSWIQKN
ncbi:hypothetical protein M9Y10_046065 [Tritrichomonas musculus]|uniref:Uncharacterized protein n=1 Tax=Tritrichomonas musculus TaxID=1915356 RepID=A0ABR2JZY1_9EUKA